MYDLGCKRHFIVILMKEPGPVCILMVICNKISGVAIEWKTRNVLLPERTMQPENRRIKTAVTTAGIILCESIVMHCSTGRQI